MNDQEWRDIVRDLNDLDRGAAAAAELQRLASAEDIPRLVALLDDTSFVVREAAAWPLSDLGATQALPSLLQAHHRGTQEGFDNDGLTAAIIDLLQARPAESTRILRSVLEDGPDHLRSLAVWALEFCGESGDV